METRKPLFVGIGIGVVVLAIAATALVAVAVTGIVPLRAAQDAVKIVPADAGFFAAVSVDLTDVAGFRHLQDVYGDLPQTQDAMDSFAEELEPADITWKDDIAPWLGSEAALAITNVQAAIEGDDPVVILAVATRKEKASDAFLEKMLSSLSDEGYTIEEETYEKVTFSIAQPEAGWDAPVVVGTIGKFVVITSDPDAMRTVIDVERGKTESLARNERYTEMMANLPKGAQARVFVDLQTITEAALLEVQDEMWRSGVELPQETVEMVEAYRAMGLTATLDKEGVRFDVALTFDPDLLSAETRDSFETKPSANRILREIPADVLLAAAGQDLGKGWTSAYRVLAGQPDGERQLQDIGDELGMRLDEDLLAWLTGEFALVVIETPRFEALPMGGFLLSEVGDHAQAEATLDDLVGAVEVLGGLEFDDTVRGAYEMRLLRDPGTGEVLFGMGLSAERFLLALSEDAVDLAASGDWVTLAENDTFKTVQAHLPGKTASLGFVDLERLLSVATADMPEWDRAEYDESVAPVLEPIMAIGFGAEPVTASSGLTRVTAFVYIP